MDEDYSPSTKSPAALSMEPIESSVMTQILPLQCFRSSLHNCSCVTMPRPTSRSGRIEASSARWWKGQRLANKRHPINARWVGGMFVGKLKGKRVRANSVGAEAAAVEEVASVSFLATCPFNPTSGSSPRGGEVGGPGRAAPVSLLGW